MSDLPLSGLRVLVTRSRAGSSDLSSRLRDAGAEPVEAPLIQIADPKDWTPLDRALTALDTYEWLIFTSGNAVEKCIDRLHPSGKQIPPTLRIAAVGAATVKRLQSYGIPTDYRPDRFDAEALVAGLSTTYDLHGARVLFPCGDLAGDTVASGLTALGATVTPVTAYRTILVDTLPSEILDLFRHRAIHAITFTSSSTVNAFVQAADRDAMPDLLSGVAIACIGPVTARTAAEAGITVDVVPEEATIEGLVGALEACTEGRWRNQP